MTPRELLAFGPFTFDPNEGVLAKPGERIPLTPKQAQLLTLFLERAGQLVGRDEIVRRLWPDVAISPGNVGQHVFTLRKVLGTAPDGGEYIETETKRGYRFVAPVSRLSAAGQELEAPAGLLGRTTRSRRRRLAFAASTTLAAVLLATAASRPAPPKTRTFAVLPLGAIRCAPSTQFPGYSRPEEIGSRPAPLPGLRVRAAALASSYRTARLDTRAAGRELGAGTLLVGTYAKASDTLRLSFQLVDARDGGILFGDTVSVPYDRLSTAPDLVAEAVARGLRLAGALPRVAGASSNAAAYEYYLRGVDVLLNGPPDSVRTAIGLLEKATSLDPHHAASWAVLGGTYRLLSQLELVETDVSSRAGEALRRAEQLAPDDPEVLLTLADYRTDSNRVEEAVPLLRRLLRADPDSPRAHWRLSYAYRYGGLLDESLPEAPRARTIGPPLEGGPRPEGARAEALLYLGRPPEFIASFPR